MLRHQKEGEATLSIKLKVGQIKGYVGQAIDGNLNFMCLQIGRASCRERVSSPV